MNNLKPDDVEWVVNSISELGVKIGDQFFFCYKGHSLVYNEGDDEEGTLYWRPIGKREFGECIHPRNYENPKYVGKVSMDDGKEWKELPLPEKDSDK